MVKAHLLFQRISITIIVIENCSSVMMILLSCYPIWQEDLDDDPPPPELRSIYKVVIEGLDFASQILQNERNWQKSRKLSRKICTIHFMFGLRLLKTSNGSGSSLIFSYF